MQRSLLQEEWEQPSRKRVKVSTDDDIDDEENTVVLGQQHAADAHFQAHHNDVTKDKSITIASTAKHAPQNVTNFLAKHIPVQYAPQGQRIPDSLAVGGTGDSNTKYCYRHRPDMLCRRQADEPSMEKLQKVSSPTFP